MNYISHIVSKLDESISGLSQPYYTELIKLASDVPGFTTKSASYIIAENGADMTVFKSAKHLCSWAGLPLRIMRVPGKRLEREGHTIPPPAIA